MITKVEGGCEYPDCQQSATQIAADAVAPQKVGVYCDTHAEIIIGYTWSPTVVADCPNCQCTFGVWP